MKFPYLALTIFIKPNVRVSITIEAGFKNTSDLPTSAALNAFNMSKIRDFVDIFIANNGFPEFQLIRVGAWGKIVHS